jgi:hypothetical protein
LRVTNTDPGKDWSKAFVKRVGATMKAARRGRSAKWLSARTAELGYEIPATVISKLDSGHRGEVLSVAELLVLAAALDIPPALLLFPEFPGTEIGKPKVKLLPDRESTGYQAVRWLSGERALPASRVEQARGISEASPNAGTQLVFAVRQRETLSAKILDANMLAAGGDQNYRQMALALESELSAANAHIDYLREQLGIGGE